MRDEFLWGETLRPDNLIPPPGSRLNRRPVVQGDRTEREGLSLSGVRSCRWLLVGGTSIDYRKYRKRIVYNVLGGWPLAPESKMVKAACPGPLFWQIPSSLRLHGGPACASDFWGLRLPGCGRAGQNRRGWGKFVPAKL